MEEGKVCMNAKCASSSTSNAVGLRKGWPLQSGGYATLCHNCGTAYKELVFCEMFHSEDTGWRECTSCGKRIHCGCIASSLLVVLLDTGGVNCNECSKSSKLPPTPSQEKPMGHDLSTENGASRNCDTILSTQTGDDAQKDCENQWLPSHNVQSHNVAIIPAKLAVTYNDGTLQDKNVNESLVQTNLSIGLSASSNLNPFSLAITEEKESSTAISSIQQGFRTHHLLPKLSSPILSAGLETKSRTISPIRVARPPVERRVKNQLLPRYWPRITDQELRQISGDSNSTIVPLFEKVLSASDAGRIGRLVLPKACAEAYFPPISQPEGLPLRIQDVKGKEWVFQFRFWPNNNSRMYVLEGVTPCIQSMQLQAGDTVTFSRMDPEGKLLMGFRKASNTVSVQDSHSSMHSSASRGDLFLANAENIHIMNGCSGLLQSLKGSGNSSSMSLFSKHAYPKLGDDQRAQPLQLRERKRSRNIGQKSKRLLMDGHDALELKLSWDELQDLLRPPPCVETSTLSIEDHEFEEFEEPPVFGKRSIFIVRLSGEQEQWAQCDSCLKLRKVPCDLLLPPKWTCQDNGKDQTRSTCSVPDELNALELENLIKMNKEFKRQRLATSLKSINEQEYQETESQENATAVGGDHVSEAGCSSSAAAAKTTKHPRHRPGCSCIVCIQPPSGKGKHKPTCTCNVCMTVKRRFKTLMMRKQKRQQSEREAQETALRNNNQLSHAAKEEAEVDSVPNQVVSSSHLDRSDNTRSENEFKFRCHGNGGQQSSQENVETCSVKLDLNSCPGREQATPPPRISMMSLVREASLPLETYLRQNGLTSLVAEQQVTSPRVLTQVTEESPPQAQDNQNLSGIDQEHEDENGELSGKDQVENDMS